MEEEGTAYLFQPRPQQILNCSFDSWYCQYKNVTIRSRIIPIPTIVVDYLKDDGMFMPEETGSTDFECEWGEQDELQTDLRNTFQRIFEDDQFKCFLRRVREDIVLLDGKVFPKLNWSSPRDASWIALNNSLCCCSPNDILMLLKSSEFITHDLTNPFLLPHKIINAHPISYHLVLRKWIDVNPANEFRIFVFKQRIIAICQRSEQYAKHLSEQKEQIVRKITKFFYLRIKLKFPEDCYTLDVYLPSLDSAVILIDFNAWCGTTDGLLFQWNEIESLCKGKKLEASTIIDEVVFRMFPEAGASHGTSLHQYAFPTDIQHLSTGEDASKLIDLMKLKQQPTTTDSDSD